MHISDESFKNFYEKGTDKENILKHCAQCDYCAERLAEALPIQMSVQPMPYLNDMILKETAKYSPIWMRCSWLIRQEQSTSTPR